MNIIIIGAGAAGLMAAVYASRAGAKVTLLERNEKLGKKIYITGKGRCNMTNSAKPETFMSNIVRNPRFTYSALAFLSNVDLMELFKGLGLEIKIERGGRVYPASDHASDVTKALEREIVLRGVKTILGCRVKDLLIEDGEVKGVKLESGDDMTADAVIVATGGLSYPSTGSTGDGYGFADGAGIKTTATRPSLTGIETVEAWPWELSGLTLKNVKLSCNAGKKKIFDEQGEMLFTHYGVSGPLVLSLSSLLPNDFKGLTMSIDLKPALDRQTLDARLIKDFKFMSRRQLITVMDGLEPHNLAVTLLQRAGLDASMNANSVTAAQRAAIVDLLKDVKLEIKDLRGYEEAVITRGGVDVKEINPSTMESKKIKGLYFAGEVIDIDAMTGGFNLQLAFSTGALAGDRAARRE